MIFQPSLIKTLLFAYIAEPLKMVEAGLNMRESRPTQKSMLPALVIAISDVRDAGIGIGGFLKNKRSASGVIEGEIYGRYYHVGTVLELWFEHPGSTNGFEAITRCTDKLNELFSETPIWLRKRDVLHTDFKRKSDGESGTLGGLLPGMSDTVFRTFELQLVYELKELKTFEVIKTIDVEERLA